MRTIVLTAVAVLLAPVGAAANPPVPAVESAGAHPGEPLICHYYYYEGRVLPRPVCKTEHQWVRERLRAQADVSQFQLRSLIQHP